MFNDFKVISTPEITENVLQNNNLQLYRQACDTTLPQVITCLLPLKGCSLGEGDAGTASRPRRRLRNSGQQARLGNLTRYVYVWAAHGQEAQGQCDYQIKHSPRQQGKQGGELMKMRIKNWSPVVLAETSHKPNQQAQKNSNMG